MKAKQKKEQQTNANLFYIDTAKIPAGKYGDAVRCGRDLMLRTAYLIGPDGVNGHYTNNKMNCTNCHQDGGPKPIAQDAMARTEQA